MTLKFTNKPEATTLNSLPWGNAVFTKDNFWINSEGLHYAHLINRTLSGEYAHTFRPDHIFYVGKYPAAYIKTVDSFSEPDIRNWHRFLWNQAVVPILILQDRTKIRVYTANESPVEVGKDIPKILEDTADALEALKNSIEEGKFYEDHKNSFQRNTTVDHYLLAQLNATASGMAQTLGSHDVTSNLEFIHRFLTRILFICYLIERDMIKGSFFSQKPLSLLRASDKEKPYLLRNILNELDTTKARADAIFELFAYVKKHFNGSLFPESLTQEKRYCKKAILDLLMDFLNGHDQKSGQRTLGFWAYDFSVIPIETISSIYETFLKAKGELNEALGTDNSQRKAGAYYTPPHLAELTADIALDGVKKPTHELTVFDPSCGSGVFLVTMLGRMADSLRRETGYKGCRPSPKWGAEIMKLLRRLHGLDINPTACHISCFSLYLAALEQMSPLDLETLQQAGEKFPPLLLDKANGYKDGCNIICANFFSENIFTKKEFDLVIGNPPWVSRTNSTDSDFIKWRSSEGKNKENILAPEKQMANGFMWKASKNLSTCGKACLLLPTSVFLNNSTNSFQKAWLKTIKLERVINFSDLRRVLFDGAIHPCIAVKFSTLHEQLTNYTFLYESPKVDVRSQAGGAVYIREEDTARLPLNKILKAAEKNQAFTVWKSLFWGTGRDLRLLTRLSDFPKLNELAKEPSKKDARWIKRQGCQPYSEKDKEKDKKPHSPWWDSSYKFLQPGKHMNFVVDPSSFIKIPETFNKLRRSPSRRIFDESKIFITQGSKDMKVAFCSSPVIFRDSLQSISAPQKDADLLRFLSVAIKSDIIQYYLFHTSANWGTERDKVHFNELLNIPFFLPEQSANPENAQAIVKQVAKRVKNIERKLAKETCFELEGEVKSIRQELEPLIREYYGITPAESILIDDTLRVVILSSTPSAKADQKNIPTLKRITEQDCVSFGETLCSALTLLSKKSTGQFSAKIFHSQPYSLIQVTTGSSKKIEVIQDASRVKKIMHRLQNLLEKEHGNITFCQNLKIFDEDILYILKPARYRFWMKSAALNDADEIAGAILSLKEERTS